MGYRLIKLNGSPENWLFHRHSTLVAHLLRHVVENWTYVGSTSVRVTQIPDCLAGFVNCRGSWPRA